LLGASGKKRGDLLSKVSVVPRTPSQGGKIGVGELFSEALRKRKRGVKRQVWRENIVSQREKQVQGGGVVGGGGGGVKRF